MNRRHQGWRRATATAATSGVPHRRQNRRAASLPVPQLWHANSPGPGGSSIGAVGRGAGRGRSAAGLTAAGWTAGGCWTGCELAGSPAAPAAAADLAGGGTVAAVGRTAAGSLGGRAAGGSMGCGWVGMVAGATGGNTPRVTGSGGPGGRAGAGRGVTWPSDSPGSDVGDAAGRRGAIAGAGGGAGGGAGSGSGVTADGGGGGGSGSGVTADGGGGAGSGSGVGGGAGSGSGVTADGGGGAGSGSGSVTGRRTTRVLLTTTGTGAEEGACVCAGAAAAASTDADSGPGTPGAVSLAVATSSSPRVCRARFTSPGRSGAAAGSSGVAAGAGGSSTRWPVHSRKLPHEPQNVSVSLFRKPHLVQSITLCSLGGVGPATGTEQMSSGSPSHARTHAPGGWLRASYRSGRPAPQTSGGTDSPGDDLDPMRYVGRLGRGDQRIQAGRRHGRRVLHADSDQEAGRRLPGDGRSG